MPGRAGLRPHRYAWCIVPTAQRVILLHGPGEPLCKLGVDSAQRYNVRTHSHQIHDIFKLTDVGQGHNYRTSAVFCLLDHFWSGSVQAAQVEMNYVQLALIELFQRALDKSSGLILRERVTPQRFRRGMSSKRRIGSGILESRRSSRQRFWLASWGCLHERLIMRTGSG